MNEKKDLLNDLKIDRSEDNEPGSSFIKRLGFVLVSIIILFLVLTQLGFLSQDEIIEVNAYKAKSANQSNNSTSKKLNNLIYFFLRDSLIFLILFNLN